MRLACRECGKEYVLAPGDRAGSAYEIRCAACGAAAGEVSPGPVAPGPGGGEYVDLVLDEFPAEAPRIDPSGATDRAAGGGRAGPVEAEAERPGVAADLGEALEKLERAIPAPPGPARRPRALLVAAGALALLLLGSGGYLAASRRSPPAAAEGSGARYVVSTGTPPLAAPDPEVEASEARDRAAKAARSRAEAARAEARLAASGRAPAVEPEPAALRVEVAAPVAAGAGPAAAGADRPAASEAGTPVLEDAPAYPVAGFHRPTTVVPDCVRASIRLPRDLGAAVPRSVTVRFAVGRDGKVGLLQVQGDLPDRRIEEAVRAAVQGCEFRPGTDAQGHPARMWVVMPLRFVGG